MSQLKDNVHAISACYDQRIRVKGCIIKPPKLNIVRYYSYEHENLAYTSIEIFKENFLFGSGVKTFFHACKDLPQKITLNSRKNLVHIDLNSIGRIVLSWLITIPIGASLTILFYVILRYFQLFYI